MPKYLLMIAAAGVLVVSLALVLDAGRFAPRDLPHGFASPGLALQFARQAAEVEQIVGGPADPDRDVMRSQVALDWPLIACYAVFFVAAGALTMGRREIG